MCRAPRMIVQNDKKNECSNKTSIMHCVLRTDVLYCMYRKKSVPRPCFVRCSGGWGFVQRRENRMDCRNKIRELRASTGMNRREFCDYFQIPYRTVTDWELDNRHAPEYVLRLLEYYIRHEELCRKTDKEK